LSQHPGSCRQTGTTRRERSDGIDQRGRGKTGPGDDATGVGELSYSDAGAELDAIIEEFETGVIDVDRLVEQLQRATDIVDELDRRLRRTRIQVEELVPRLEAIGQPDVAVVEVIEVDIEEDLGFEADEADEGPPTGDEATSPGLF
jgi:exonuclease VII small subunit